MHFITLILVPNNVWTDGRDAIHSHIDAVMERYNENTPTKMSDDQVKKLVADNMSSPESIMQLMENYSLTKDVYGTWSSPGNSESILDYFTIGGQWPAMFKKDDNSVPTKEPKTPSSRPFCLRSYMSNSLDDNSIQCKDLLAKYNLDAEEYLFYTIVDSQGKLHSYRNHHTWQPIFGMDEWNVYYQSLLIENINSHGVVLDCHV